MFQIQNKSGDASPWLLYPADNKTVWIVTVKFGRPLVSQIVNFDISSEQSTPVVNLTNSVPTDILYDHTSKLVWIVENDSLAYYDQARNKFNIALTFPNGAPQYLAVDSQDHFWLTLLGTDQIVEYFPATANLYNYSTPTSNAGLQGIAVSPVDGSVWFAEAYAGKIGHLTPCGTPLCPITEYSSPPWIGLRGVIQLAVDGKGTVWFTNHDGNEFGSFDPSTGDWKLFPIGYCPDSYVQSCDVGLPNAIALDPAGQVWFSEHFSGRIGRYDPNNQALIEYTMPTNSAVCSKGCTPYSWWMWPGQDNLVWFVAFGLGEIGYVNSTVPVPFSVAPLTSVTINHGSSTSLPIRVAYSGEAPAINASATSQDTSPIPSTISLSVGPVRESTNGIETSTITITAAWSSASGPRYVAVTAYNENLTVNAFVRVEVVASIEYTTLGIVSGISAFSAFTVGINQYSKRRNGRTKSTG